MTGQYYNTNATITLHKIFICSEILRIKNISAQIRKRSSRNISKVLVLTLCDHNIVNLKKVDLENALLSQRIL